MLTTPFRTLRNLEWRKILIRHIPAVLVFIVLSWAFMGRSLTECSTTVLGGSGGDHLSGIISLLTDGNRPYGGRSVASNYPFGEDLTQPQLVTNATLLVPTWILSKIVSPICSWNIMVFAGYMLSSLTMYGFVLWLLKRRSVALFAAIAVAFTPYHYFKTHGHLSYIHSELFVLLLWSFLALWKKPTMAKGVVFGGLVATLFYTDGYFPMIGGVMVGALVLYSLIGVVVANRRHISILRKDARLKSLLIAVITASILLLPIVAVKLYYGEKIQGSIAAARSSTLLEVQTYGARVFDFFVPSETQPIEPVRDAVMDYRKTYEYSNKGEYHLFLGYSVLALAGYALFALRKTRFKKGDSERLWLVWVSRICLVVFFAGIALSLVPSFTVFGISVPLPSKVAAMLTDYWRVYARLYMVVNVAIVTIASIGFLLLLEKVKKPRIRLAVIVFVILFLIVELLPINPFSRKDEFSTRDFNDTYTWLGSNPEIKALAAYPLTGTLRDGSYFADQLVHKKPLLNSYSIQDKNVLFHRSLSGMNDGQTLGALKSLGINELLLYRIPKTVDRNTTEIHGTFGARVVRINDTVTPLNFMLVPDEGYHPPIIDEATQMSCRRQIGPVATIRTRGLKKLAADSALKVSFDVKGHAGQIVILHSETTKLAELTFTSNDQVIPFEATLNDLSQTIKQYTVTTAEAPFPDICNLTTYN